jgi:hypothetical protein
MSRIVSTYPKGGSRREAYFLGILDHVSSVPEPTDPVAWPKSGQGRNYHDSTMQPFRYGNRAVIKDLKFRHPSPARRLDLGGATAALVKSTLVNLMCRFYDLS